MDLTDILSTGEIACYVSSLKENSYRTFLVGQKQSKAKQTGKEKKNTLTRCVHYTSFFNQMQLTLLSFELSRDASLGRLDPYYDGLP